MRKVSFKVKDTIYSIDASISDYIQELKLKEWKNPEEVLIEEKFSDLFSIYQDKVSPLHKKVAYVDESQFVAMDIQLTIGRPSTTNLSSLEVENNKVRAEFTIPLEVYEGQQYEFQEFIDWYINNYISLFKYIVSNQLDIRVIQLSNIRPFWNIENDCLKINLTFQIVFK